jgi:hypothetical protein
VLAADGDRREIGWAILTVPTDEVADAAACDAARAMLVVVTNVAGVATSAPGVLDTTLAATDAEAPGPRDDL